MANQETGSSSSSAPQVIKPSILLLLLLLFFVLDCNMGFWIILSQGHQVQLQQEEEELLSIYGAESGWVEARTSCDHLASLSSDLAHIPTPDTSCHRFTSFSHTPTLLYFYHFHFLQNIYFYLKKNYNHTHFVLELLWSTTSINFNNWNHSLKLLAWK